MTIKRIFRRVVNDESGQIVPWMVFLMILFFGAAGLTIDLGHAYVCYRDLQASTDAAALAGAYAMTLPTATTTSVRNIVATYSSTANGANSSSNLPGDTVSTTFRCVNDAPSYVVAPCSAGPAGNNVIQVVQQATIPTYFIRMLTMLGLNSAQSLTLTAESTATMMNGKNQQINLAVVLDSTASMGGGDTSCGKGGTKMQCALSGVQTLLGELAPCTASSIGGTCVPYDQVSLFTYPNVEADTAKYDTDSNTSTSPTIKPYYVPSQPDSTSTTWVQPTGTSPTYQITGYQSDYSSNNQRGGGLSTSSNLYNASNYSSRNSGIQPIGGQGTYFAGAVNAAQASLMAAQLANPGSLNYMIILSDGAANSTTAEIAGSSSKNFGDYGSAGNECQQAIAAAQNATALGTTVYSIAYGASNSASDCSTDYKTTTTTGKNGKVTTTTTYTISPCQTLQQMASAPEDFYADTSSNCGTTGFGIDTIFGKLGTLFTKSRLIPNGIT
jgi:hypothetical protein